MAFSFARALKIMTTVGTAFILASRGALAATSNPLSNEGKASEDRNHSLLAIKALHQIPLDQQPSSDFIQIAQSYHSIGNSWLHDSGLRELNIRNKEQQRAENVKDAIRNFEIALSQLEWRISSTDPIRTTADYQRQRMITLSELATALEQDRQYQAARDRTQQAVDAFKQIPMTDRTPADKERHQENLASLGISNSVLLPTLTK